MQWIALGAIVLVAAVALSFMVAAFPTIPDADSYFHLAVAREYAQHGLVKGLRWARLSVMHERFGDKELLFHVELIPAVLFGQGDRGGRVALVLANLAIVAILGAAGLRLAGTPGLLTPLIVYLTAPGFFVRVIRLRPELGAIVLVIAFLWAASRRRTIVAGVIAAAFALSYTAMQLLPGLAILTALAASNPARRPSERPRESPAWKWWMLALSTCLGTLAGAVAHPHFPDNVRIWYLQNVEFFRVNGSLDAGKEIGSPTARFLFIDNAGWWIVIIVIVALAAAGRRARRSPGGAAGSESDLPSDDPSTGQSNAAQLDLLPLVTACLAFAILQVLFERMSLYFFPVATLTALALLGAARPLRRQTIVLAAALCVAVLASSPTSLTVLRRASAEAGPLHPWRADLEAFGRAVPRGARVAAPWGPSEFYTFFAPQGEYLDVLDPLFMFAADPAAYQVQLDVFRGVEPDVPLAVATMLQSDFIAFDRLDRTPLFDRLSLDPRLRPLYAGYNYLGAITAAPGAFVLDWRAADGRPYPRLRDPHARSIEGYVNAVRFQSPARCITLIHDERVAQTMRTRWEFAPYGTARLWIDGAPRVAATAPTGAYLGHGAIVNATLSAGLHRFTVETCHEDRFGQNGFYLMRR